MVVWKIYGQQVIFCNLKKKKKHLEKKKIAVGVEKVRKGSFHGDLSTQVVPFQVSWSEGLASFGGKIIPWPHLERIVQNNIYKIVTFECIIQKACQ